MVVLNIWNIKNMSEKLGLFTIQSSIQSVHLVIVMKNMTIYFSFYWNSFQSQS